VLIYIAALFDERWVWHVKLHRHLSPVVIDRCNGHAART